MNFILAMCVCDQLCPDLCDSLDCSPPGSSVYGVPGNIGVGSHFLLQDYSWPGDQTHVSWISCTGRWILSLQHPGSPDTYIKLCKRYWYFLHITDEEIESKVLTLPEIHASHIKIHLLKDIWAPSSHKYAVLALSVL